MRISKKCVCGKNHSVSCSSCSKIRMVLLLKSGNRELKYRQKNNRYTNPVWYSPMSKNRKSVQRIIDGMYKRFEKSKYKGVTNKVMFYDNYTKELIISK